MEEAHQLIAAFRELNATNDRSVTSLTPSLIGLFGTPRMFEVFLDELDAALSSKAIAAPLRERATNLARTFIPQVAGYNGIPDPAAQKVSAEQLRSIRIDTPENRRQGVEVILAGLMQILAEVNGIH